MADGAATPPGGVVFAHHQRVLRDARARLERFRDQGSIRDLWEAIRQLRTAPQDPARPEWTVPQRTLLADCLLHLWRARRDPEVLDEALRVARSAADLAGLPGTAPGDPDRDAMAAEAHHVAARVLREAARAASRVTGTHPRGAPGADPARRGERRPPTPDPATLPTAPPAPRPGTDADPDLASAPDRASDARPDLARSPGPDRSADLTPAPDLASAPDRALDARPDLSPGPDLTPDRGPGQDADLTPDPDRGPGQGADPASAQCPGTDPLAPAQETPAATVASDPDALLREAGERLEPACEALRDRPELLFPVLITLVDVARDRYRRSGDHRALSAVLPRLDALLATWPPPPAPVLPLAAVRARGRVLLDLAAEARSRGDDAEARGLAVRATVDHAAAADLAATRGAPAAETVHGLLELADARAAVTGDPGAGVVIAELRRALRAAGRDGELRLPVLHRLGDAHYTGFLRTREVSCLLSAERAYAGAQLLVDLDDPVRAELLTGQGRALVARAERTGDLAVATDAVRLLRGALAETPDSDPRLAGRRLLFGRALRLHHAAGGALTDLHEAEWVLGRAARGAEGDGRIAADAWLERGDVLVALARHGSAPTRLDQAVDCYRRAAEAATRAADPLTAARAHHQRGAVLERTAGPVHAGEAYRAAWEQWERAGATGDPRARATRERMRALTDDDSP
jgi:tetratricopeptide (TPR) repeat protein